MLEGVEVIPESAVFAVFLGFLETTLVNDFLVGFVRIVDPAETVGFVLIKKCFDHQIIRQAVHGKPVFIILLIPTLLYQHPVPVMHDPNPRLLVPFPKAFILESRFNFLQIRIFRN